MYSHLDVCLYMMLLHSTVR